MPTNKKRLHPTRNTLIAAVIELLETNSPEDIKVEDVLGPTGISVGSLYHHFTDLSDLIDQAIITRYSADIDLSIAALTEVVRNSTDAKSLLAGFRENTVRTQSPDRGAPRPIITLQRGVWSICDDLQSGSATTAHPQPTPLLRTAASSMGWRPYC